VTQYLVGTSGWHYDHWRDVFYPPGLPRSRWLGYYCRSFASVEVNNTFYRLPTERAFLSWKKASPRRFLFAVKASRLITHVKRLKEAQEPLNVFLARTRLLAERLGPILFQMPPQMRRDDVRLESFLKVLPPNLQFVFEFRHSSWLVDEVFELLREYRSGFCIYDMPDLTTPVVATTDYAYVRFHGASGLYSSRYSDAELEGWADRLRSLEGAVRSVYIYFNNDAGGYAVENARTMASILTGKS
jgi:uncharacterized protein YecE (DUF72 family)